jgi:proline iminopeptidase
MLFVHGGPGMNSKVLEYMRDHNSFLSGLDLDVIFYDQRNCGRSTGFEGKTNHQDNIEDLDSLVKSLISDGVKLKVICGHSYGAKLLNDYCIQKDTAIPAIFIATAKDIITPRMNNLLLDLNYLKSDQPDVYGQFLPEFEDLSIDKIWDITVKLAPYYLINPNRMNYYWANTEKQSEIARITEEVGISINSETFSSVREDLYSDKNKFELSIEKLDQPTLWINGFHDYIMDGNNILESERLGIKTFNKSAHYPHIEEEQDFCKVVNEFIKSI